MSTAISKSTISIQGSTISILSFDCAIKNLAWARLTVQRDVLWGLNPGPLLFESLRRLFTLETGLVNLIGARDIKEVPEIERVQLLAAFLKTIPSADYVLVERQPAMIGPKNNTVANAIACQITYHYILAGGASVHYMSPMLKNGVSIADHVLLSGGSSSQKYAARKKHAVDNYLAFNKIFALGGPTKGKLDDIADATMQAIAFICKHRLLNTVLV